ncbi:MAG TPA: hypothetical protein VH797_07635 [Nitrososphaeraceae archaeon]|jgi:hypothetical protein
MNLAFGVVFNKTNFSHYNERILSDSVMLSFGFLYSLNQVNGKIGDFVQLFSIVEFSINENNPIFSTNNNDICTFDIRGIYCIECAIRKTDDEISIKSVITFMSLNV